MISVAPMRYNIAAKLHSKHLPGFLAVEIAVSPLSSDLSHNIVD